MNTDIVINNFLFTIYIVLAKNIHSLNVCTLVSFYLDLDSGSLGGGVERGFGSPGFRDNTARYYNTGQSVLIPRHSQTRAKDAGLVTLET